MNYGVSKRVDELGRIVIPKEIRNTLKIDNGDILNVDISGNKIELSKQNDAVDNIKFINKIYESFVEVFNEHIIITDKEKVILSNLDIVNLKIDKYVSDIIKNNEYDFTVNYKSILFNDVLLEGYFYVCSISNSLSTIGSVILYSPTVIDEKYNKILKMLCLIINKNIV